MNPAGASTESLTSNPRVREQPGPTAEVEAHQFVTRYTEGLSHFVTSMTAPVASGWSDGRVELAPTVKAPPYHGTPRADIGSIVVEVDASELRTTQPLQPNT